MQRQLPIWVAGGVGTLITVEYFLKIPALTALSKEIQSWTVLISAFLLGVGMVNLLMVNIRGIRNKKTDELDAVVLIGAMLAMFIVTVFNKQMPAAYNWLFHEIYAPLGTAVFSLLMYSMASAAFRAIRVRSVESTIFLIAAAAAMLGVAPVGEVISKQIPAFYNWLLKVPNLAGQRGITIGAAVGAMAASLRVILGIERRYIGME